jgi:stage II sporulation protein D
VVWGSDVPYLRGVVDPNCAGTPEYSWTLDLDAATLAAGLGARFASLGSLRAAALRDPDDSGRPKNVALDGATGSIEVATRTFRDSLGTGVVRSTLLRAIAVRDGGLHLEGSGRGHGVGLCQWGARMLGAAGSPAAAIVGFYFPGTALGTA